MAFTFETYEQYTPVMVFCEGKLTMGFGAELRAEVKRLAQTHKEIVLEMTFVEYIDSLGIGIITTAFVSARNAGCRLRLANMSTRVRDLLSLTQVLRVIETYDNMVPPGIDRLP